MNSLLIGSALLNIVVLIMLVLLWKRADAQGSGNTSAEVAKMAQRLESLDQALPKRFTEIAVQLEKTRGELNLELTRELSNGLLNVRSAVESQLTKGREEQMSSLATVTTNLEGKFDQLTLRQSQNAQESRAELTKSLETI